jgi:peptidoglycan/LPS O-acetylase OafA/YrhL
VPTQTARPKNDDVDLSSALPCKEVTSERKPRAERLTTSESLLLDIIRVCAATLVAVGHLTQFHFSTGWPDLQVMARGSVVVFFILSGFVIRYITSRRATGFADYLDDRASRIYSVALPALLITFLTDSIARHVNPGFYAWWEPDYTHAFGRIIVSLFFAAQLWTLEIKPLSNAPFWSLNYEVAYYLLYGCAFYLRNRKRWIWIGVVALIVGPKILLLFPIWLLGSYAHDLYQRWNASGTLAFHINRLSLVVLALSLALSLALRFDPAFMRMGARLNEFLFIERHRLHLGMTGGVVGVYAGGLLGTVVLMQLLLFARRLKIDPDLRSVRILRFIAEGTFPIYLLHYPLYVLIAACIPYNHGSSVQKLLILFVVVTLCILAGHPANLLKMMLRRRGHTVVTG